MEIKSKITPEESLKIISDTILKNSKAIERSALNHSLLWGVLVVFTAMVVGHLWEHNGGPIWNLLWFAMTIVGIILERLLFKNKPKMPQSHLTSIFMFCGKILGAFCIVLFIAVLLAVNLIPYNAAMMMSYAMASFIIIIFGYYASVTGYIMRNKIVIALGIFSGTFGTIAAMLLEGSYKMLVIAAAAFLTMVLPYFIKKYGER